MLATGLVYVPMFARTARAAVLPVRDQEYIEAAHVCGLNDFQIIRPRVAELHGAHKFRLRWVWQTVFDRIPFGSWALVFLYLRLNGEPCSSGREFIRITLPNLFPGL